MALKSKQKYDPSKIERLAEHIRIYHDAGDPVEYEIVVDGFKAVRRTSDPEMFSLHESFLGVDTKVIEINFYHADNTNTYDKHIFLLQEADMGESLNGLDVDQRIMESVQRERKEWEHELIRQENERLKKEVAELENEVEELEKEKDELINNRSPLEGVLGEFGSTLIESFIRRNPKVIASLPGGEALAGMIQDNQPDHEAEGTEVSFKAKSDDASALNDESRAAVEFVNQLKAQFTKEEFDQVLIILHDLANDKEKIEWIIEQLQVSKSEDHEQI